MRGKHINDKNIETVCMFEKVKKIDFEENDFTNSDTISKNFPNIEYANLTRNQFTTFPKSIFEMSKLKILKLRENRIITLPEKILNR